MSRNNYVRRHFTKGAPWVFVARNNGPNREERRAKATLRDPKTGRLVVEPSTNFIYQKD